MRVFRLLSEKYAIEDLKRERLKVARFADLNDQFELLSVELRDRATRRDFSAWRKRVMGQYGVLCFSKSWKSPVLWSHYADKHRGICLGFDVPDDLLRKVEYLSKPSPLPRILQQVTDNDEPGPLFHTKFDHWDYEDEIRRIVRLEDAVTQNALHFCRFGEELELKEVVVGARCNVADNTLKRLLGNRAQQVRLTKARCAFTRFEVIPQKRGFKKPRKRGSK